MLSNECEEVLFEFVQLGRSVKVTALDPVSMIEVSIVGASTAGAEVLKALAYKKLLFQRAKK